MQSVDVLRLHLGIGPPSLVPLALSLSLSEFRFTELIRISYPRLPEWPPGGKPTAKARGTLHVKLDKSAPPAAFDEGGVHTSYSRAVRVNTMWSCTIRMKDVFDRFERCHANIPSQYVLDRSKSRRCQHGSGQRRSCRG